MATVESAPSALTCSAAVVERAGDAPALHHVGLRPLQPDEVLVRTAATGICHSDIGWAEGQVYDRFPVVLGHEVAGTVERLGSAVVGLRDGARVAVSLAHRCGVCRDCEAGHPILCSRRTENLPRISLDGRPVFQGFGAGGFAELVVVRASSLVPVPDGVPWEVAAIAGCALATGMGSVFNLAQVPAGATVAVLGAGAVGLCSVMAAVVAGADRIVVADPHPERRASALAVGATEAVVPEEAALRELVPDGFDHVLESAGVAAAMELAVRVTRRGGTTTLIGVARPGTVLSLDAQDLVTGARRLLGSLNGDVHPTADFDRYFRLYLSGRLPLDALFTSRVGFSDIAAGFEQARTRSSIKTVVGFGPGPWLGEVSA
jgi:Zn-dependent alcohol dehydrogenase